MKSNTQVDLSKAELLASISNLEDWVESRNYRSYEPFDGLLSFLKPLTFSNQLLERILQQTVRQSPINLRPILGIRPVDSTKGRGYMASGYLVMLKVTGKQLYKQKAVLCLDWLMSNKAPKYHHYCWGNHFPFSGRSLRLEPQEPIIVWTSLIGQAFLDAFETLELEKYLEVAKSICDWIMQLPKEKTSQGSCLSYVAFKQVSIHNANMLGAAMLARTGSIVDNSDYLDVAEEAMKYSCSRQLPDGAWYYGEAPNQRWIDNFHTGYNLDSLKCYIDCTGDQNYHKNLQAGFEFFRSHFFEESGMPKYYHNRAYPIDSQCASQAIESLAGFSTYDSSSLGLATKVAIWTIKNMQDRDGHFFYRLYPFITVKTPMLHWAQATMYRALSLLISKLQ